jgi:hypothetical protein
MKKSATHLLGRAAVAVAVTGVMSAATLVAAPSAFAAAPKVCTAHKANTATWANCQSTNNQAYWARLTTDCDIPGSDSDHTTVGRWELVPAGGELTISGNCTFKAVNATVTWRPY